MEQASPRPASHWQEMLDALCALGGAAQNIAPGKGAFGRGLVAVNPAEPVLLRIPQNLLVPVNDIECTDGRIGIAPSSTVGESERRFFEAYEETFSWGAGGRSESSVLVGSLDRLPAQVRELLIADFGFGDVLEGDIASRALTQFLRSRAAFWRQGFVIAPVLELANRSPEGLRYERGTHLQIQGYVRNEILIRYGNEDACSTFFRFGIAERQPAAFSLSMNLRCDAGEIVIRRNFNDAVMHGRERVPRTHGHGRALELSYLMLGHGKSPRMARGIFRTLMGEAGMNDADETFDQIVRINILKFVNLLKSLEPYEGEMIAKLRKMARYQLEAMTWCVGSRQLSAAARQ